MQIIRRHLQTRMPDHLLGSQGGEPGVDEEAVCPVTPGMKRKIARTPFFVADPCGPDGTFEISVDLVVAHGFVRIDATEDEMVSFLPGTRVHHGEKL